LTGEVKDGAKISSYPAVAFEGLEGSDFIIGGHTGEGIWAGFTSRKSE